MAVLPDDRRCEWLDRHAPWMRGRECRTRILSLGHHWYSAKSLGQHLELKDAEREQFQAWSIEAIDVTKEERAAVNREKNRKSQNKRRRKRGVSPRAEWLAQSVSRAKPWLAFRQGQDMVVRERKANRADRCVTALSF
jgi:hypothetical protein